MEASPIGNRIASGIFWSIIGTAFARGLTFLAFIFVARFLGKQEFGELGMIQSTVMLFGNFAGFGLGQTSVKYIAQYRVSDPEKVGRIMAMANLVAFLTSGLACLALGFLANDLAANTIAAPHLATELRIGILILFLSTLVGVQTGSLSGFEAFKSLARVNIFAGIISFIILIAGVFYGRLRGAIWGLAISQAVNLVLNHWAIRKEMRRYRVPLAFSGCSKELSILWKFSIPAMLGGMLVGPVNWACNALLVNQPKGYMEMGIFQAANQCYAILLFLPLQLSRVILPVLSERLGQQDVAHAKKIMILMVKINAAIIFPVIIIASASSRFIMGLFGGDFKNGWPTLILVLIASGIVAIQTPVGQVLWASTKSWQIFTIDAIVGVVFFGLTWLWVKYGAIGLASARLTSFIASSILVSGYAFIVLRSTKTLREAVRAKKEFPI